MLARSTGAAAPRPMRATRFLLAALAVGLGVPTGAQTVVTESDPDACELWACATPSRSRPRPTWCSRAPCRARPPTTGASPATPTRPASSRSPRWAGPATWLHRAQLLPGGPRRPRARLGPAVGAPQCRRRVERQPRDAERQAPDGQRLGDGGGPAVRHRDPDRLGDPARQHRPRPGLVGGESHLRGPVPADAPDGPHRAGDAAGRLRRDADHADPRLPRDRRPAVALPGPRPRHLRRARRDPDRRRADRARVLRRRLADPGQH